MVRVKQIDTNGYCVHTFGSGSSGMEYFHSATGRFPTGIPCFSRTSPTCSLMYCSVAAVCLKQQPLISMPSFACERVTKPCCYCAGLSSRLHGLGMRHATCIVFWNWLRYTQCPGNEANALLMQTTQAHVVIRPRVSGGGSWGRETVAPLRLHNCHIP